MDRQVRTDILAVMKIGRSYGEEAELRTGLILISIIHRLL